MPIPFSLPNWFLSVNDHPNCPAILQCRAMFPHLSSVGPATLSSWLWVKISGLQTCRPSSTNQPVGVPFDNLIGNYLESLRLILFSPEINPLRPGWSPRGYLSTLHLHPTWHCSQAAGLCAQNWASRQRLAEMAVDSGFNILPWCFTGWIFTDVGWLAYPESTVW